VEIFKESCTGIKYPDEINYNPLLRKKTYTIYIIAMKVIKTEFKNVRLSLQYSKHFINIAAHGK